MGDLVAVLYQMERKGLTEKTDPGSADMHSERKRSIGHKLQ